VAAQWHVRELARAAVGEPVPLLVTPSPFNTVLWRVVAVRPDGSYDEGFYSFFDDGRPLRLQRFEGAPQLRDGLREVDAVRRLAAFTHGFYKLHARDGHAWISDLRMGQEPNYSFSFRVARHEGGRWHALRPQNMGSRGDARAGLAWVWQRMWGADPPPPR
jgi:inner membrane protein